MIARHCLQRLFTNQDLWPHFKSDQALSEFWALGAAERRAKWGEPIDIMEVQTLFSPEDVRLRMRD